MLLRAIVLAFLLPSGVRAADPLIVYDRQGNTITVANRFDGENYSIRVTETDRSGRLIRDDVHSDGYQELVTAVHADSEGNVYLAGMRYWQGAKYLWVMKYYRTGNWSWEWSDDYASCTADEIAANEAGDSWVAGACLANDTHLLRVVRLQQRGAASWSQTYPTGSRCHVRNLNVDDGDRAAVTALLGGPDRADNASIRTVVYDGRGYQLATY